MIDVSIIIVNYNTKSLLSDCIDSVFQNTQKVTFEIIVVDNGSVDGSREYFENDNRIQYIYSEENLGFGKANNVGAKFAIGKFLFLLNPDTLLINNAIKFLVDFLNQNPEVGIVGGNLYDSDLKPCLSYRQYLPGLLWEINDMSFGMFDRVIYGKRRIFNNTNHPLKVGYITGADLLIKRDLYNLVSGFDESFFLYYEETDLCKRVKDLGYQAVCVHSAKIQHLEGKSFSNPNSWQRTLRTEEGRKKYYIKNIKSSKRYVCNTFRRLSLTIKSVIDIRKVHRFNAKQQLLAFNKLW